MTDPHAETVSYGIDMTFGGSGNRGGSTLPTYSGPSLDCSDSRAVKVAVLDGGLDVTHDDFSFCGLNNRGQSTTGGARCMGERFFQVDFGKGVS